MLRKITAVFVTVIMMFAVVCSCSPVDKDYGVSETELKNNSVPTVKNVPRPQIKSLDRVMSKFIDISLFDEENYSQVYLGRKYKMNLKFVGDEFKVPAKLSDLKKKGWKMVGPDGYKEESQIYAGYSVNAVFEREDGRRISGTFYNSSNSSEKLDKCYIVKFHIDNDYYSNPENYGDFNLNGVNNQMGVTDVIDTLGTPSHFYGLAENSYYLDYFITKKDRRNGLTVYIDPVNDSVTAVELSSYE